MKWIRFNWKDTRRRETITFFIRLVFSTLIVIIIISLFCFHESFLFCLVFRFLFRGSSFTVLSEQRRAPWLFDSLTSFRLLIYFGRVVHVALVIVACVVSHFFLRESRSRQSKPSSFLSKASTSCLKEYWETSPVTKWWVRSLHTLKVLLYLYRIFYYNSCILR